MKEIEDLKSIKGRTVIIMSNISRKILLPSFGAHIFDLEPDPDVPTMHIPPVIQGPHGMDLDYSALLLFDTIIIDSNAKAFIDEAQVKVHRQLKESLHILEEEGKAEFIDYAELTRGNLPELNEMLQAELRNPLDWLPEVKEAVIGWKKFSPTLFKKKEDITSHKEITSFGVWRYLQKNNLPLEKVEMERVESIFLKSKIRKSIEQEIVRDVSETYLLTVCHTLQLSRDTNSAAYDWNTLQAFYRRTFLRAASPEKKNLTEQDKIRELFRVAVPDYQPYTAYDFVKLQKDKRIKSLRKLIKDATQNDISFDREFYVRTLEQIQEVDHYAKKIRRRTAIWTAPLLLLHLPGHLLREAIVEGVEHLVEKKGNSPHQWLLLLAETGSHIAKQ